MCNNCISVEYLAWKPFWHLESLFKPSNLNKKCQTDAILLDLSEAFDKGLHGYLLHKLNHYGIHHEILEWISSFLSNRTWYYLVCNGSQLSSINVISGVPHDRGNVLGLLLFLAYINDLPDRKICCKLKSGLTSGWGY